jgi:hypothetical protein
MRGTLISAAWALLLGSEHVLADLKARSIALHMVDLDGDVSTRWVSPRPAQ